MKKFTVLIAIFAVIGVLTFCGGEKPDVTPDGGDTVTDTDTVVTDVPEPSVFDDTEWQNVLAVLQEYLEAENKSATPANTLNAGKSLILAVKFIQENQSIAEYGFTQDDVDTYKNFALMKFNSVIGSPESSDEQIAEAEAEIANLANL